ncbi:MAG: V-type ATP synthase subunit E [Deltaproteobacteria bacterium]|jgi:V/A-type H+-transporting ATPase subunit E
MPKLEEILQAEVASEIDGILAEADKQAAALVSEAKSRAAARLAAYQKKLEAEVRTATQQAQSAAELAVSSARMQAKGEVMDLLRQKVLAALEKTSSQPGYGKILQALAEEALSVAGTAEAVIVTPPDREKLEEWAQRQGLELQTDPELRLGVRIVGRGGATVENTLLERLQRVWNTLGPGVAGLLWE